MAKQLKIKTGTSTWTTIDELKLTKLEIGNKESDNGIITLTTDGKVNFSKPIKVPGGITSEDTLNVTGPITGKSLNIKNDQGQSLAEISNTGAITGSSLTVTNAIAGNSLNISSGKATISNTGAITGASLTATGAITGSNLTTTSLTLNNKTLSVDNNGVLKFNGNALKATPYIFGTAEPGTNNSGADQDLFYVQKTNNYYVLWVYNNGWKRMNAIWG